MLRLRRQRNRELRQVTLGIIVTYGKLKAKSLQQLRNDIVELLTADGESPSVYYVEICWALDWLKSKRRVRIECDKRAGYCTVSPR